MTIERKIISPQEVQNKLVENLKNDQQYLSEVISHLKHGQKERLINAMASYPLTQIDFDDEPELQQANLITRRISDTIVAIATEHVVQSMVAESIRQQKELEGVQNESTEK